MRLNVPFNDSQYKNQSSLEKNLFKSAKENNERRIALALSIRPDIKTEIELRTALNFIPCHIPPGVDVIENMNLAKNMNLKQFYDTVKNKGPWDYKQLNPKYAGFGNWNYAGATNAMGLPERLAILAAGIAQMKAGTSTDSPVLDISVLFTSPTSGDDIEDVQQMRNLWGLLNKSDLSDPTVHNKERIQCPESDISNEQESLP